ncbi:MAG: site-specific DNA-methyltransferase [Bacteroidetes bacterium]|nr:site-specific DNA-methyltransferase [Bacteroidota bacterium]
MQNLLSDLQNLLQQDERCVVDGKLLKNKITELALQLDSQLLKLLLSHAGIKKHFFQEVDGVFVFDKIKFQRFVNNKAFLEDSYTSFKNKIGLITHTFDGLYDEFISENKEVVLSWPYKDCVLEGGQTKEDVKRDEIFWNETLAPDQINKLLAPKVLTNFKKYDKDGEHTIQDISLQDNLIIKGNNLLALHSLKKVYAGKIKVIYIDPPYNPDSKSNTFCYNNSFNESTWLSFMKNRLEVAKELLTKDGALIVAIDENEHIEIGMLLKEIFKEYEIHCITIVHNPRGIQGTNFSYTHEYAFFVIPEGRKTIGNRKINEEDIDWRNLRDNGGESLRTDARNCFYPIIVEDGAIIGFGDVVDNDIHPTEQTEIKRGKNYIYPIDPEGIERKWRYARQTVDEIKHLLRAKKTKRGFEIELGKDFGTYRTVWQDSRYDANDYGTKLVKSLVSDCKFDFPKSLYNVYDCLYAIIGDDKNAIVLDFFAGSGTTAHAVLELNQKDDGNRKFILCEQMKYIDDITKRRVWQVIKNNNKNSFIYSELSSVNQTFVDSITSVKTTKDLQTIFKEMQEKAFLSYKIKPKNINETAKEFAELSIEDQKKFLIELLDKNLLYVPYSEIEDKMFAIPKDIKELNNKFYSLK